jgi:hypothetical protein
VFVRDATNVKITPAGKALMRDSAVRISSLNLANLWHSKLHADTFATLEDQWVIVDVKTWTAEGLVEVPGLGDGPVSHEVLNNQVAVATQVGIFVYYGTNARRLTIDTPPPPMLSELGDGALGAGTYGVAVAWLRGSVESAPSEIAFCHIAENRALDVILPMCFDANVTHVRLYLTRQNGGELARGETYPINTHGVSIPLLPDAGAPPQFLHLDPMPTGKWLRYWRGRLLTARGNVLRFSEALAYHLHDQRHGFIQMPQRITFVAPVDGGIWLGQVDHVVFLAGDSPSNLQVQRRKSRAPVPDSAVILDAQDAGEMAQGGQATAVWLAENGYVAGTASGAINELHANIMGGITAESGTSVVFGDRLLTVVR